MVAKVDVTYVIWMGLRVYIGKDKKGHTFKRCYRLTRNKKRLIEILINAISWTKNVGINSSVKQKDAKLPTAFKYKCKI